MKHHSPFPSDTRIDLRKDMPPVKDQGELNSGAACAVASALEYQRRKTIFPKETWIIEFETVDDTGSDAVKMLRLVFWYCFCCICVGLFTFWWWSAL